MAGKVLAAFLLGHTAMFLSVWVAGEGRGWLFPLILGFAPLLWFESMPVEFLGPLLYGAYVIPVAAARSVGSRTSVAAVVLVVHYAAVAAHLVRIPGAMDVSGCVRRPLVAGAPLVVIALAHFAYFWVVLTPRAK
jgi:hypothetical protein